MRVPQVIGGTCQVTYSDWYRDDERPQSGILLYLCLTGEEVLETESNQSREQSRNDEEALLPYCSTVRPTSFGPAMI